LIVHRGGYLAVDFRIEWPLPGRFATAAQKRVGRDSVEPGAKVRPGVKAIERLVRLQEGFLVQVICIGLIARQTQRIAVDLPLLGVQHALE